MRPMQLWTTKVIQTTSFAQDVAPTKGYATSICAQNAG